MSVVNQWPQSHIGDTQVYKRLAVLSSFSPSLSLPPHHYPYTLSCTSLLTVLSVPSFICTGTSHPRRSPLLPPLNLDALARLPQARRQVHRYALLTAVCIPLMLNDASAGTIAFKHDVKSTGTRCRPLFFHHRYSTTHWQARSPSSTTASSLAALYLLATLLWDLWLWSVASGSIVLWRWLRRLVAGVSCDHVWVLSYLSFSSSCSSSHW